MVYTGSPNYKKYFTMPHFAVSYRIVLTKTVACTALESLVSARLCPQNASAFVLGCIDRLCVRSSTEDVVPGDPTADKGGLVVGLM